MADTVILQSGTGNITINLRTIRELIIETTSAAYYVFPILEEAAIITLKMSATPRGFEAPLLREVCSSLTVTTWPASSGYIGASMPRLERAAVIALDLGTPGGTADIGSVSGGVTEVTNISINCPSGIPRCVTGVGRLRGVARLLSLTSVAFDVFPNSSVTIVGNNAEVRLLYVAEAGNVTFAGDVTAVAVISSSQSGRIGFLLPAVRTLGPTLVSWQQDVLFLAPRLEGTIDLEYDSYHLTPDLFAVDLGSESGGPTRVKKLLLRFAAVRSVIPGLANIASVAPRGTLSFTRYPPPAHIDWATLPLEDGTMTELTIYTIWGTSNPYPVITMPQLRYTYLLVMEAVDAYFPNLESYGSATISAKSFRAPYAWSPAIVPPPAQPDQIYTRLVPDGRITANGVLELAYPGSIRSVGYILMWLALSRTQAIVGFNTSNLDLVGSAMLQYRTAPGGIGLPEVMTVKGSSSYALIDLTSTGLTRLIVTNGVASMSQWTVNLDGNAQLCDVPQIVNLGTSMTRWTAKNNGLLGSDCSAPYQSPLAGTWDVSLNAATAPCTC